MGMRESGGDTGHRIAQHGLRILGAGAWGGRQVIYVKARYCRHLTREGIRVQDAAPLTEARCSTSIALTDRKRANNRFIYAHFHRRYFADHLAP